MSNPAKRFIHSTTTTTATTTTGRPFEIGRGDGNIICDCNNLPVSNDQSKPLSKRQTERFSPKDKNVNMQRVNMF